MTDPRTMNGLGLRGALRKSRTMPDPEVNWSEWIAAIEAEATAAAEQRLRAVIQTWDAAMVALIATNDHDPIPEFLPVADAIKAARRALSDAPSPASPRQGEPVEGAGLSEAWEAAEAALRASKYRHLSLGVILDGPGYHAFVGGEFTRLHAWSQGDFPDLPDYESPPTPATALYRLAAALSEPAEAGDGSLDD